MRTLGLFVLAAVGCGNSSSSGNDGGGSTMDAAMMESAPGDDAGGEAEAAPAPYPAFKPAMPQMNKGALSAIAAPVIVPVYFMGETLQMGLDGALATWMSAGTFKTSLAEYGVTGATAGMSIPLTEAAGMMLTSDQIQTWIEGKLDGTHSEFGLVDMTTLASKIFVLYYPSTSMISLGSSNSCTDFGGYHAGVTLGTGAVANYIVLPRCTPAMGVSQTDDLTGTMSALVISATCNPVTSLSSSQSGWQGFDVPHEVFGNLGSEVGTACAPEGLPMGQVTSRAWSNAAAAGYHDPCLPAPTGAYFVSVPVATDHVTLPSGDVTKGVSVPIAQSKTIDVQLLSDSATSGPWNVATKLVGTTGFTFTLDQMSGNNGDTIHLTVTAPATPAQDVVAIFSTLDQRGSFWMLPVVAK